MSNYHKFYTPQDSAVVFIDHQPQMTFGVANTDRATLINNVTLLAKVAKEFNVPKRKHLQTRWQKRHSRRNRT